MRIVTVYHDSASNFLTTERTEQNIAWGTCQPVAVVQCSCAADDDAKALDQAFERTNTIDRPWWENPGITKCFKDEGCRSTSVGDVMVVVDLEQPQNVAVYVVEAMGFRRIVDHRPQQVQR